LSAIPILREEHGYNEFSVEAPEHLLIKFIKTVYESPLNLLLLGSACVSAIMGNIDDAVSITVAILIVLTVGFVQERRSEESLEALNKLVPHHCHLIRDGRKSHTLANELLPGDLVTFGVGDRIPADLRLIQATALEVDESSLTGETVPSTKSIEPCPPGIPVPLAERSSIAFMGTLVRNGHGSGIVIATGAQTEFGVIFSMMQDVEEKRTPLQLSMDDLAQKLSFISFGIIGVICVIGVIQDRGWLEMFTIGGERLAFDFCLFCLCLILSPSLFGSRCHSGRTSDRHNRHARIGRFAHVTQESNRQEASQCRGSRMRQCCLLG